MKSPYWFKADIVILRLDANPVVFRTGSETRTRHSGDLMSQAAAWSVLIAFYAAPLAHVLGSRRSGPFRPPPGSRCPLGPRAGWLTLVLLLGPIGWLLYMRRRRHQLTA
jgi:hypothetical protein